MKARAVALLLVAALFTAPEQQNTSPEKLYAEARLAFDRGEIDHALAIGKAGRRQFGDDDKWQELFTMVVVESLGRNKLNEALFELQHAPRSGDREASIRRLMAEGYINVADGPYAKADALAARWMPLLRPEIAVRRAGPAMRNDAIEAMHRFVREAMERTNPVDQPFVYANARIMLASAAMKRGDYQRTIEQMRWAEGFARAVGAKGAAAIAAGNRGYTYSLLGDTQEALAGFEEALRGARELGNAATQTSWLANIAGVYVAEQQFDRALQYAQQSVAVAERFGEPSRIALALSNLAQVEIELHRYTDARNHIDRALAIHQLIENKRELQFALLNRARIDGATGAPDVALATLEELTKQKDLPLRWNAQAFMARIYHQQGKSADAERMYKAALDTGDHARVESRSDDTYLFAFEANLIRFYDEWIDLLLERNRTEEALLVAERSRARTLRRDAAEVLPSLSTLARAHGATILSYWIMPQRSLVWVVTGEGLSVIELPPAAAIAREIEAYRNEIIHGNSSRDSARGRHLFQTLVEPVPPKARVGRVIVIADGPLTGINLESLIVPEPEPHYWVEDVTISYSPSLHYLKNGPSHRSLRGSRALVMGDVPDQGAEFPHLTRAGAEIESVAQHFDRRHSVVFTGNEATVSAYLTSDLCSFRVIHFAAHSTASVHSPLESSVILAKGGRLSGHEIVSAPICAELVTVSSCNSSGRRIYVGEGMVGLAWAFLDAGARRVVAAQWEVSDSSTPKMMNDMYRALGDGRDPADALRDAKLALVHSRDFHNHPFYWAPFILYGAP